MKKPERLLICVPKFMGLDHGCYTKSKDDPKYKDDTFKAKSHDLGAPCIGHVYRKFCRLSFQSFKPEKVELILPEGTFWMEKLVLYKLLGYDCT